MHVSDVWCHPETLIPLSTRGLGPWYLLGFISWHVSIFTGHRGMRNPCPQNQDLDTNFASSSHCYSFTADHSLPQAATISKYAFEKYKWSQISPSISCSGKQKDDLTESLIHHSFTDRATTTKHSLQSSILGMSMSMTMYLLIRYITQTIVWIIFIDFEVGKLQIICMFMGELCWHVIVKHLDFVI